MFALDDREPGAIRFGERFGRIPNRLHGRDPDRPHLQRQAIEVHGRRLLRWIAKRLQSRIEVRQDLRFSCRCWTRFRIDSP